MKKLFLVLFSLLPFCARPFSMNGGGSPDDPYLIVSSSQLTELSQWVNDGNDCEGMFFRLDDDIDFSYDSSDSWVPIGDFMHPFSGYFDGANHHLDNIRFERGDFVGLFGYLGPMAVVKDLYMDHISGWSNFYMGAICGMNEGEVVNCHTLNGTMTCSRIIGGLVGVNMGIVKYCSNYCYVMSVAATGGIVGFNYGEVEYCTNSRNLEGALGTGGIVGYNGGFDHIPCEHYDHEQAFINCCENSGYIKGESYSGGICGRNDGYLSNCRNIGNVKSAFDGGGIAGANGSDKNGEGYIFNSYSMGNVYVEVESAGGICASNNSNGHIENVYFANAEIKIGDQFTTKLIDNGKGFVGNCFYLSNSKHQDLVDSLILWADTTSRNGMLSWSSDLLPDLIIPEIILNEEVLSDSSDPAITTIFTNIVTVPANSVIFDLSGKIVFRNGSLRRRIRLPKGIYLMNNCRIVVRD